MKSYIVKFKNDLKNYQAQDKKLIAECEKELQILEKVLNNDLFFISKLIASGISKSLSIASMFITIEKLIHDTLNSNRKKEEANLKDFYEKFKNFVETIRKKHTEIQNIINAFENDKIKDPINDLNKLIHALSHTTLSQEEACKIIGMAISFNSQYAKKKKNHSIHNIDIINKLAEYYNPDGTFKYNEDTETFKSLIEILFEGNLNIPQIYKLIMPESANFELNYLVELLKQNNQRLKHDKTEEINEIDIEKLETQAISPKTRLALQELRKYYKNGTIITLPENLDEFYQILDDSDLDDKEKKYIINLINNKILESKNQSISNYLNEYEQEIYTNAVNLLNSFSYSNSDVYVLKQYIEELQTILSMLEIENNALDKEYLLSEIPNIIEELETICSRYKETDKTSSNRFIFLLNKEGIPYIYDDINSLDASYRKPICSLLTKIEKSNQAGFRKVLNNEQLAYNMYEVISTRGHISFIEIDAGIYLIMGANIPRNGYKEFNNRLRAYQKAIQELEIAIKDPESRNQILKDNEQFLAQFINQDTTTNTASLKRTKPSN